jgi:hypothetical protein
MPRLVTNEIGVRGVQCPWCLTVVQALPDLTTAEGLARHVQVVHPEHA